ncbi:MAG TPA: class I SAM-dependent methyltransferase [Candidatus Dormibacteraeota bacterium]|nr:class I SAM-dependent methyltransferase [Candidatus Dormibacteraeota bacterium]
MLEAAHRRVSLFGELVRDPRRFWSLIRKDIELLFDATRKSPDPYEAVSWESAVGLLAQDEGTTRAILAEPALAKIEADVVAASIGRRGPWPATYNADRALARCAYVVCRLVRPTVAVETGVAYGVTSAYILAALEVNSHGTLHSIDLPPLGGDASWIGALVPERLRSRWRLHVGLSRAKLPEILALGPVDFFLHDSLHTYSTMRWELTSAWASLRDGGAMIADDIQSNDAFREVSAGTEVARAVAIRSETKAGSVFGVIRRC